jgi:UDP-N-acetylglucosamine acyltransferase
MHSLYKKGSNFFSKNIKIFPNVTIGKNNKFFDGCVIYPNTIIGNNNVFLNNNILGEHPVHANEVTFKNKKFQGLQIGNNNFFHVNNIICTGHEGVTKIGNNNKFLSECHVSHDCLIEDHVHIYPRVFLGGYVKMLSYSGAGAGTFVHQKKVIGSFAFTSMNSAIVKHSFPFFININNEYSRLNLGRIQTVYPDLILNEEEIRQCLRNFIENKNCYKENLPKNTIISSIITDFLTKLKI